MNYKTLTLLIFLMTSSLISDEMAPFKKYINFNHTGENGEKLNPEDFAGYDELRRWANFQGMSLKPDSGKYGLQDGICRMIPSQGFSFYLTFDTANKKPIYLYLDLTTYDRLNNEIYPIRALTVLINGKTKAKIYFDKNSSGSNPYRITVDPVECPTGRINVTLIPDSTANGRFWGIWDVFYSYVKE
ncbi:MAG TPA: hypothetical protein PK079_20630 [Leptospiraceae bacterium]|nr:hypothetical protein [Leptospiraceae bacterium]HMW06386.1 hypothetical protein [Leptospiraceae bacterium]HMX31702.1 hypothetical protein [Leptospiraceae bacterium]HMY31988.1 hypothetical protein [Leptospiraceae bacterium]HMZ65799.1 hypothetical protein [Leptospiraceae bacterium]